MLLNGFRRNQGPSSVFRCFINTRPLADALRGNKSVEKLVLYGEHSSEDLSYMFCALAGNIGLKALSLADIPLDDESWSIMCHSLVLHPALEELSLDMTASHDATSQISEISDYGFEMATARLTRRSRALAEMVEVRTGLRSVYWADEECDTLIIDNDVYPRLEMNEYRFRVAAMRKPGGA